MIKRRFYKVDHGDKSGSSSGDPSSSSSGEDSDDPPEADKEEIEQEEEEEEEKEEEQEEEEPDGSKWRLSPSPGSGYESEDSSGNEIEGDPTGLIVSDVDDIPPRIVEKAKDPQLNNRVKAKENEKVDIENITTDVNDSVDTDFANCILKCKSVFRCRLCPRIVCLSEESLKTHLQSKRHTRSRKLFGEGRLKLMLNSDGEIEEDQETHAERHSRTIALAKKSEAPKKKDSGRQRQSRRRKRKMRNRPDKGKEEKAEEKTANKKRKAES